MSEQKRYTAQEMRDFADAIAADLNDCGHTSVTYRFDDLLPIIQCLRHSAEVVERCEAEIAKLPYPPNADDVYMFKRLNYILRGDAGKEAK